MAFNGAARLQTHWAGEAGQEGSCRTMAGRCGLCPLEWGAEDALVRLELGKGPFP
jgi:hypothetical protein